MACRRLKIVPPAVNGSRAPVPVVMVHGLGEHSEASVYRWLASRFAEKGLALWRFDLSGHGESEGRIVSIERWDDFRADLNQVLDAVGGTPYILGFSLGALVTLDHALAHPERHRGAIAMAPPLGDPSVPRLLLYGAQLLDRFAPHFPVRSPYVPRFSRWETAELAQYRTDPLIRCAISGRLATEMMRRARQVRQQPRWDKPLLLLQGERDQICNPRPNYEFASRASVELKRYPDARHHLLLEPCRERIVEDVSDWIRSRETLR